MKPVLLSGIQPSGRLHIGNYLGALKNFVELQNTGRYQCYFFIADLHSLTEDFEPREKNNQITALLADYLAAGLTPAHSTLFLQSHVPSHTELAWILNTITPFGEMSRMTQFKDKSETQKENINVGLFAYPTLMAADIILYDTQLVPVGEDQLQHLELTRTLARKFNLKFGQTFVEPQPLLTASPRIMSLQNPLRKMSKSQPDDCLFLDDSPEQIEAKIMNAVTDSAAEIRYRPEEQPGIANLLRIYAGLSGKEIVVLEKEFEKRKYAQFKKSLVKLIIKSLKPFRLKKEKLLLKKEKLLKIAHRGAKTANKIAAAKMSEVKNKIGLL